MSVKTNPKYDPNFTQQVIDATGPKASPRVRSVTASLVRHMHDFARENDLTVEEYMQGVELMNWAGKMSDDRRNEGQLVCDVLGLESLVDEITFKLAAEAADAATATAVLGPFFRHGAPRLENGASIVHGVDDGEVTFLHGKIVDAATRRPIPNTEIDIWQASTNGLYEQQDENQSEYNLRGQFVSDAEGCYNLYCLRPTPYPIPDDGPAGKLLKVLDRHCMRPAHIHFIARHDDYKPLTTQIFDRVDKYLGNDAVFAVKDSLTVDFQPRTDDPNASLQLEYDIALIARVSSGQPAFPDALANDPNGGRCNI